MSTLFVNGGKILIEEAHKTPLRNLIAELRTDQSSYPFLDPVNWESLGLHDYPTIIKKPMDLATLRKNLDKGRYKYFEEFNADVQLVWNNCKSYNVSGSEIYRLAENMERKGKKLLRDLKVSLKLDDGAFNNGSKKKIKEEDGSKIGSKGGALDQTSDEEEDSKKGEAAAKRDDDEEDDEDEDFGFDPERYVPFDEKVGFADLVKRCTKDGLTEIVKYLQDNQPEAVEDFGNDRLQIKIDVIERPHFNHCKDVLNHHLKEAPNKRQKTAQ